MKKIAMHQCKLWLVWGVSLAFLGLQISCTPENPMDRNVQVIMQIPLPNPDGLKMASSIAGIQSVTITVTTGSEILTTKELTISGNKASGTLSILPGKNRKFTAEARDGNNIIQWQGSATVDIVDDFTVNIGLTPMLPSVSSLLAVQEGKSVKLSWTQNSDPDFARYILYRSQSNGTLGTPLDSTTVITETVYKDSLAVEGNTYFYTLVVTDTEGFDAKSNVVQFAVLVTLPTASILVGTLDGSVYLNWTQNHDSDFAKYELYRSQSENPLEKVIYSTPVVTDLEFVDSKVSEGNTYFYTLVVTDTDGNIAKSNVFQIVVPNLPPTPSVLTGTLDGSFYLIWTQNYNPDFARYELHRSTSPNEIGSEIFSTNVNTETNFTDSSVSEGNIYYYKLIVFDAFGSSAESNLVTIDIKLPLPTASVLEGGLDGPVYLNWTQNYDSDFAKYELYRSQSATLLGLIIDSNTSVTHTEYVDSNVSEGNTYFYRVVVTNTKGSSSESNLFQIDIPIIPPMESSLKVDSVSYNFNAQYYIARLSWTQNYDSDFSRYELYRSTSNSAIGERIKTISDVAQLEYWDSNLSEGITYYYTLIVYDQFGSGTKSKVFQLYIPISVG